MLIVFLVLVIVSAVLLILIVLLQDEGGDDMGGIFGGGGSSTAFGTRSGNVLTRITVILAIVFFVSTFLYAYLNRTAVTDTVTEKATKEQLENTEISDWYIEIESETDTGSMDTSADTFTGESLILQ